MKIPKTLKVGGFNYKVIQGYKFKEKELAGQADHRSLEIRLSSIDPGGNKYAQAKIEECFLHELLHAVDCVYNCNKLDEDTVDRLSNGLYQVLKDNKILRST